MQLPLKNNLLFLSLGFLLSVCLLFSVESFVFAQGDTIQDSGQVLSQVVRPTGISTTDLSSGAGLLIQRVLGATGIVFLILSIFAGIRWMMARGNESEADKARDTLLGAVIGLIIIIGAYAITTFFVSNLQKTVQGEPGTNPGIGDGPPGCCLDRVNADWACRLTTNANCVYRGTLCEAGDDFCGNNDYDFQAEVTELNKCLDLCAARRQQ